MAPLAVLDASALVRATVPPIYESAVEWLRRVHASGVRAWAPELICAEVAQTLCNYVRARQLTPERAGTYLTYYLALPLQLESLRPLAPRAVEVALACRLSAYDAFYVALARALDATLVTADRRLAEHHDRVALLA